MRLSMTTWVVCSLLAATLAFAGSIPSTRVEGNYVEARTAEVYTGPCFANSEVGLVGDLAVLGWKVTKGSWQGVKLDGLGVVAAIKASATLGDVTSSAYPVKSVLIIDERADAAQREALKNFARRMGGDLLDNIVRVEYRPIELEVENGNVLGGVAKLRAGELARIETRAIETRDCVCSNEELYYLPLTKVGELKAAYTLAHSFQGQGLGVNWQSPYKRSAFIADFSYQE